jgi:hypothetical protein
MDMRLKRFLEFVGVVAVIGVSGAGYVYLVRPRLLRWGASKEEAEAVLPGDELIPQARLVATHAVTIKAPPEKVWPWLVQIGHERGGMYSYDWLEHLAKPETPSADRILPEHQDLAIGDMVQLHANLPAFRVIDFEPTDRIIFLGDIDVRPRIRLDYSWAFILHRTPENTTRLLVRSRIGWDKNLAKDFVYHALLEPASFIMERKMLLNVKRLAEEKP